MNGHRMHWNSWNAVLKALAVDHSVVAYNRAGTGNSDAATSVQSGQNIVDQLLELLDYLNIETPCVFVAHSLGGLFANLLARSYPEKVSALVLVESGHPEEAGQQAAQQARPSGFLPVAVNVFEKIVGQPRFKRDPFSEFNGVEETIKQLADANNFPDIPLIVVTGTKKMLFVPEDIFADHLHWQGELVKLSPSAVQLQAKKSGHMPQLSEPDLVVSAIVEVLNKIDLRQ